MLLAEFPRAKQSTTIHATKNKIYHVSPTGILFPMKFSKQISDFCKKSPQHKERLMEQAESAETVIA